jgi:acyl-CoA thioesterase FadM
VFDDILHVHTRCRGVRGARFRYEYAIVRDDGALMADGYTEHACVDSTTLKPTRVPDWLRDAIALVEASSSSSTSSS